MTTVADIIKKGAEYASKGQVKKLANLPDEARELVKNANKLALFQFVFKKSRMEPQPLSFDLTQPVRFDIFEL